MTTVDAPPREAVSTENPSSPNASGSGSGHSPPPILGGGRNRDPLVVQPPQVAASQPGKHAQRGDILLEIKVLVGFQHQVADPGAGPGECVQDEACAHDCGRA